MRVVACCNPGMCLLNYKPHLKKNKIKNKKIIIIK